MDLGLGDQSLLLHLQCIVNYACCQYSAYSYCIADSLHCSCCFHLQCIVHNAFCTVHWAQCMLPIECIITLHSRLIALLLLLHLHSAVHYAQCIGPSALCTFHFAQCMLPLECIIILHSRLTAPAAAICSAFCTMHFAQCSAQCVCCWTLTINT